MRDALVFFKFEFQFYGINVREFRTLLAFRTFVFYKHFRVFITLAKMMSLNNGMPPEKDSVEGLPKPLIPSV